MLATVLGAFASVGLVIVGYLTWRTTRKMNEALVTKAVADAEQTGVVTEEVWQRLYGQAVEEVERTASVAEAAKKKATELEERVANLEHDVILLKAELIHHGGDPRRLRLKANGRTT